MNLTLSVDDRPVERAREVARQQGTSLNALIRDYIDGLAGQLGGEEILREFEAMWAEPGNSGGQPFKRDELYDERLKSTTRSTSLWPRGELQAHAWPTIS